MNEFDTPDKDNVHENEEEIIDSEVVDEQGTENIPDEDIQETEDAEEYNDDDSAYEYDEAQQDEQRDEAEYAQEDCANKKGVFGARMLGRFTYRLYDRRR